MTTIPAYSSRITSQYNDNYSPTTNSQTTGNSISNTSPYLRPAVANADGSTLSPAMQLRVEIMKKAGYELLDRGNFGSISNVVGALEFVDKTLQTGRAAKNIAEALAVDYKNNDQYYRQTIKTLSSELARELGTRHAADLLIELGLTNTPTAALAFALGPELLDAAKYDLPNGICDTLQSFGLDPRLINQHGVLDCQPPTATEPLGTRQGEWPGKQKALHGEMSPYFRATRDGLRNAIMSTAHKANPYSHLIEDGQENVGFFDKVGRAFQELAHKLSNVYSGIGEK